jgi:hypothetical protein
MESAAPLSVKMLSKEGREYQLVGKILRYV